MAASGFAFLARTQDVAASLVTAARAPGWTAEEQASLLNAARSLWDARAVLLPHFDDRSIRRRRVFGSAPTMPSGSMPLAEAAQTLGLTEQAVLRRANRLGIGHFVGAVFCIARADLPRIKDLVPRRRRG